MSTNVLSVVNGGREPLDAIVAALVTDAEEIRGFSGANAPPALAESRRVADSLKVKLSDHKARREELKRLDDTIAAVLEMRDDIAAELDEHSALIEAERKYQATIEGIARRTAPAPKAPARKRKSKAA